MTLARLPDSAIDLLDEACANTKIGKDTLGDQLGKFKRHQVILEMHIQSLVTDIRTSAVSNRLSFQVYVLNV